MCPQPKWRNCSRGIEPTRPEEKIYFARVQNCVLRGQVIDRQAGGERVLRMIRDLQRDSDHKLVLM